MSLINTFVFTRTIVDGNKILEATSNQYRVVAFREYRDKKGILPDGYTVTLTVLKDTYDYGVDKDGKPRDNNLYQTFDVTVLNRNITLNKQDIVSLIGFDEEHSYAIGFDLLLRFKDLKVIKPANKETASA